MVLLPGAIVQSIAEERVYLVRIQSMVYWSWTYLVLQIEKGRHIL